MIVKFFRIISHIPLRVISNLSMILYLISSKIVLIFLKFSIILFHAFDVLKLTFRCIITLDSLFHLELR